MARDRAYVVVKTVTIIKQGFYNTYRSNICTYIHMYLFEETILSVENS